MAQLVKNPPAMQETWVRSLGWEDPLEKGKAAMDCMTCMGSQRVGRDRATLTITIPILKKANNTPLPLSLSHPQSFSLCVKFQGEFLE